MEIISTLDVLTDGSEHTGDGTVFLTLWKAPRSNSKTDEGKNGGAPKWETFAGPGTSPLARYAMSGLGDGTARLCADQRFKIASTRAVVIPTRNNADGLSSLLLSSHASGSPSLHVVATPEDLSEDIKTIAVCVLGRNRNMKIMTCQVPRPEGRETEKSTLDWWNVYSDQYLKIYALRFGDDDNVAFLYSVHGKTSETFTIAMPAPRCSDIFGWYRRITGSPLPCISEEVGQSSSLSIDCILALDCKMPSSKKGIKLPPIIATAPRNGEQDPGILIRSQKAIKKLNGLLPEAFPVASSPSSPCSIETSVNKRLILRSGTSLLLHSGCGDCDKQVLDRRAEIWDRTSRDDWEPTVRSIRQMTNATELTKDDHNEIDIDDSGEIDVGGDSDEIDIEECEDEQDTSLTSSSSTEKVSQNDFSDIPASESESVADKSEPHLIVLGTGCASPSATRGSSGYAMVFPQVDGKSACDIFVLDCGEGVTTMMSRIIGPLDERSEIRGVWISHAHLDHYGGLPELIRFVNVRQQSSANHVCDVNPAKRIRRMNEPLWIMAPSKVLRYVDSVLRTNRGFCRVTKRQLFRPLPQNERSVAPGPWSVFKNIPVQHSCGLPSYGLLLKWRQITSSTSDGRIYFCYSGDTQPCNQLVQAGRHARAQDPGASFFLLHEATYQEEERDQATAKKHSTDSDAIKIAQQVPASHLLLTHFSQRYVSITEDIKRQHHDLAIGLAMDGLWLPLRCHKGHH